VAKAAKTVRVLFIGNSFTNRNDLPGLVTKLAAAARPPRHVVTDRVIANGRALKTHWERGEAAEAIRRERWDYVVLQEQSTLPLKNRGRMHESVTLFDRQIREAGAQTVLYMTWARLNAWERQDELADAYLSIGRTLGAIVVPVGAAWQRVLREHPEIVLHDRDGSHPNFAGSYLAACVFVATLFDVDPVGLPADAPVQLDAGLAKVLQDAARRVVSEFSGTGRR
jgi:hypothetical protein